MKGNLFLILNSVAELNAESFIVHDERGMCFVVSPTRGYDSACDKLGINCKNCPFIYTLKDSHLYKIVRGYK